MSKMGHFKLVENTKRKHWKACKKYYEGKVQFEDGTEEHILFTENMLKYMRKLVKTNPEDIREDGWIEDLFD